MCLRHWTFMFLISCAGVLPVCVLALSSLASDVYSRFGISRTGGTAMTLHVAAPQTRDLTPDANPQRIVDCTMRTPTATQALLVLLAAILFLLVAWKVIVPEREVRLLHRVQIGQVAERVNGAWERGRESDYLSLEPSTKSLCIAARWNKGACNIEVFYDAQAAGAASVEQEAGRICTALGMKRDRSGPQGLTFEGRVQTPEIGQACHDLCVALMNLKQGEEVHVETPA